jgi:hypothetical protein
VRTTLDIDEDVLQAIKERSRREKKSAGEVISELARQALTSHRRADSAIGEPESFYGFEPFPPRGPLVTDALVDELRTDEEPDAE